MSRAVRLHMTGGPEVLKIEEIAEGEPGPDEVLISVDSLGLNRAEVLFRQGKYLETPVLPSRIGCEASGIVEKVGSSVEGLEVGDFVSTIPGFSQSRHGVYGEHALLPARFVHRMPGEMSAREAASVWMAYLTAYGAMVELGKLKADQYAIVTAASSSVGFAAIQLIHDLGAIAIATTRSEKKKQTLLEAGADHVIVTDRERISDRVREITRGKGADLVFDAVAGSVVNELVKSTAYEGKIFIYGALSLESTVFPLRYCLKNGISISGYTMFQITKDEERLGPAIDFVSERLERGVFRPVLDKEFSGLESIAEAHDYMESNQQLGKITLRIR